LAAAQASNIDGTLYLTNPGVASTENLCSMIYVFDQNQELSECCGCTISDSGLRTLSLFTDLTGNPLTGVKPSAGLIKVVPSDPTSNPQCDPASLSPTGVLLGWETNVQLVAGGASQISETPFDLVPLASGEQSVLVGLCSALETLGSGQGICSCGTGD